MEILSILIAVYFITNLAICYYVFMVIHQDIIESWKVDKKSAILAVITIVLIFTLFGVPVIVYLYFKK